MKKAVSSGSTTFVLKVVLKGSVQNGAQWSFDNRILLRGSVWVGWRHYSPPPKGGGENIPRDLGLGPT